MKKLKGRILCFLLAVSLLVGTFALPTLAATPSSLTVKQLAASAATVAATLEKAIQSGTKDSNGLYHSFHVPENIAVESYSLTMAAYTLMAARAVQALGAGKAATTAVSYSAASFESDTVSGSQTATINKGQYLDLAARVVIYAETFGGKLPTSFNAPTDGYEAYKGRICIYSVMHILTEVLQSYASKSALPASVSFLPTHYNGIVTDKNTISGWYQDVIKAAKSVVTYVDDKEAMPTTITVGTNSCTDAQFMYLVCQVILGINSGKTSDNLSMPKEYSEPANPSESLTEGTLALTEILDLAQRSINFMENNGVAANYMITSLGNMHHYGAIYMYSQVLVYYASNNKLPASMKVQTWFKTIGGTTGNAAFGNDFSSYSKYLVPTANCQSTNTTIISVAKTAMLYSSGAQGGYSSPTTTYQAMFNLMEYINDKTSYQLYYDTSRGALGMWRDRIGNCCDMAHLVIACARSLGVPARYNHYYCHFASMSTGHVFAGLYCPDAPGTNSRNKPGWLYADPVNNANYLGYQTHTNAYVMSGPYAELPF
ncbi:MAG: transglutaminase family protein [Oscillospiraceae bacterium]|nr:transglutaminase family protein [Oscillospiraceae bacterium]